jgi:hypothetical protein
MEFIINAQQVDIALDAISLTLSFVTGIVVYLLWKEIKKD